MIESQLQPIEKLVLLLKNPQYLEQQTAAIAFTTNLEQIDATPRDVLLQVLWLLKHA